MPQSLRVAWMGLAAMAGTLLCSAPRLSAAQAPDAALTSSPAAATPAAAPATTPDLPFTHGRLADGATKSAVCTACHGPNGNSVNPEWPRLAGQSAVYITEQLKLFKAQVRSNPVMMPMAAGLSDQDINDVAVYSEAQTPQGLEPDPSYWHAGPSCETADTSRDAAGDSPSSASGYRDSTGRNPTGRGSAGKRRRA